MVMVEWFLLLFAMIASVAAGAGEDVDDDAGDDASEIMCVCVCAEAVGNQASLSMLITIIAGSST